MSDEAVIDIQKENEAMREEIKLKDFYEWLDTYPASVIKWEVTEEFEGVRWVRFIVREDDDDDTL